MPRVTTPTKPSTVLRRALKLLDGGERWIKGDLRRKVKGRLCYCAAGATQAADPPTKGMLADEYLRRAIGQPLIAAWNDSRRSFGAIQRGFERAIRLAEKENQ